MKLDPINMLWVEGELPWYADASIRSFLFHRHPVHLYTYDRETSVPAGCEVFDANSIIPKESVFTYSEGEFKGYLSGFANWFRYRLLRQKGGWWADSDCICVRPFQAKADYEFASGWEPGIDRSVNNNVIYVADAESPIMTYCDVQCEIRKDRVQHAETGPVLLQEAVNQFGLNEFVAEASVYNPVAYGDVALLTRTPSLVRLKSVSRSVRGLRPIFPVSRAKCVHIFAAIFRRDTKINSYAELPSSSLLRQLINRNGGVIS